MQRPIHQRMMNRAAHGGFLRGLHRGHDQNTSGCGLFEKRSKQFLLLRAREILAMTTAAGFAPQHRLPLAEIVGLHLPHGADLPAEGGGNLRGSETQGRTQPHALNALLLGLAFCFFQHRR